MFFNSKRNSNFFPVNFIQNGISEIYFIRQEIQFFLQSAYFGNIQQQNSLEKLAQVYDIRQELKMTLAYMPIENIERSKVNWFDHNIYHSHLYLSRA